MLRATPTIATWILDQFGSVPENEAAIGDLVEQYQRGKGSIWYWRQVLVIVFAGLYRDVRREQRQFLKSLFRTWCVWGTLQFLAGVVVMMRYNSLHPLRSDRGLAANLLPLVTVRVITAKPHAGMGCRCSHNDLEYTDAASGWPIYRIVVESSSSKLAARLRHVIRRNGYRTYRDACPADLPEPATRHRLSHYRPDRIAVGSGPAPGRRNWGNEGSARSVPANQTLRWARTN